MFLVWTKNVDLLAWGKNKAESLLPISSSKNQGIGFSLSASYGLDPIDTRENYSEEPKKWSKVRLRYRLAALATTTQWSTKTVIGVVFYSADRLYKVESEIPKWISDDINLGEKPNHHRLLHHSTNIGEVNSAQPTVTKWMEADISINHTPWNAAVYVLSENSEAQWFQITIKKGEPMLEPKPGQGVQVSSLKLETTNKPTVTAGHEKLF